MSCDRNRARSAGMTALWNSLRRGRKSPCGRSAAEGFDRRPAPDLYTYSIPASSGVGNEASVWDQRKGAYRPFADVSLRPLPGSELREQNAMDESRAL